MEKANSVRCDSVVAARGRAEWRLGDGIDHARSCYESPLNVWAVLMTAGRRVRKRRFAAARTESAHFAWMSSGQSPGRIVWSVAIGP